MREWLFIMNSNYMIDLKSSLIITKRVVLCLCSQRRFEEGAGRWEKTVDQSGTKNRHSASARDGAGIYWRRSSAKIDDMSDRVCYRP